MTTTVRIALIGFPVLAMLIFAMMPARRAVITCLLVGWLFLPERGWELPGLPDYGKITAIPMATLLAALIYDGGRIVSFRVSPLDIPMAVWCLVPLPTSLANGLGLYDGVSGVLSQMMMWGSSYFLGRLYFSDLAGIRELAIGLFIGGLVYVPLCLFEIEMSPQLNQLIYGFRDYKWTGASRLGGWRPVVFLGYGIQLGLWMTVTSIAGLWLWWSGALHRLWSVPVSWLALALLVTTILCRSLSGLGLLILGMSALFASRHLRTALPIVCLILLPVGYMTVRTAGLWDGSQAVEFIESLDADRAQSMEFRLENEDILIDKALERPWLGWGRWGRNRVYDEKGEDISVTDGLWVITLGQTGLIGLTALTAAILLPSLLIVRRHGMELARKAQLGPLAALVAVTAVFMIDCLPNGRLNPLHVVVAGALAGWVITWHRWSAAHARGAAESPGAGGKASGCAIG